MRVRYSFSSRRTGLIDPSNKHKQAFPKLAREVVRISDIVLEVLDARHIESTRNVELENEIREFGKRLIYVINKADVADMSEIKSEISKLGLEPHVIVSCKSLDGIRQLRNKIKIEIKRARARARHAKAHVGVIGYPNTGKSTLINVLARRKRSGVSAEAGFTKGIHKIRFGNDIIIIDTPGVIRDAKAGAGSHEKGHEIEFKSYANIRNPYHALVKLMEKHSRQINGFYHFEIEDAEGLVEKLGRKRSILKKGGVVDTERVSRLVLKDWQEGKIRQV